MQYTQQHSTIRPIMPEDAKRVWEIRNHPSARSHSGNPEAISYQQHASWFANKYFSGLDNTAFVLVVDAGQVVGYCRFDCNKEQGGYIVSIAIDSDFQGKGFGHALLRGALDQYAQGKVIFAEIQKDNIASVHLFKKNGFSIESEDEKKYYLLLRM
ncbi:MAG: hypothetical protein COU73_01395 [Parcubacteria group bacterium CG10_big_fil_rev_8_21_14_0_10_46_32]|nr:MAG: hypothetical protein COU73_01395 [Parcubacteria group bacterium CG10_big_fil_rev_8_21_14_0_10_46_32]